MKKWLVFGFLLALIVVGNDVFAQGCSQCKMLSEQGSELSEGSFGTNINWGILYLMIIPYLLILLLCRKRIFYFFISFFHRNGR